jgi:hypothetical protein
MTMVLHVPLASRMGASNCSFDAFFRSKLTEERARRALQPCALSECRKINSRWGIPSTRAIAGAKLQSGLLVAIRNPQQRTCNRIWLRGNQRSRTQPATWPATACVRPRADVGEPEYLLPESAAYPKPRRMRKPFARPATADEAVKVGYRRARFVLYLTIYSFAYNAGG